MSTVRRRGYRPAGYVRGRSVADNRGVRVLADKSVVLGACGLLALFSGATRAAGTADAAEPAAVIWLLLAVIAAGTCAVVGRRSAVVVPASYLLLGGLTSASVAGAPLAFYDLVRAVPGSRPARLLASVCGAALLVAGRRAGPRSFSLVAVVVVALSATLALRTVQEERARASLHAVRDDLQMRILALQAVNDRLLATQDHEVRAAVLGERTRIARDIHDGVGHVLTRLLLMVKADLAGLDSSLGEALDSMRRSVHALSDEGEDLPTTLSVLASRCGISQVGVDCALEQAPPAAVSRCVVAVVREALTNAARHGQATSAHVKVVDYPAFWQVTVDNDGILPRDDALGTAGPNGGVVRGSRDLGPGATARLATGAGLPRTGMGLHSMAERVEALGGTLRVTLRPRFTVFVMIPKE